MSERIYQITIIRMVPNPKYEKPPMGMYSRSDEPPFVEHRELHVTITEDELNAIKQALLKVWG